MNILIVHWGAYTHSDILWAFTKLNIHYKTVEYIFNDKNSDNNFTAWFSSQLCDAHYDAVFSVNYFPLIAQVCASFHMKYLSWSYDCPLNVHNIEETLALPTNYVFLFDRIQVSYYRQLGFDNVFHLPLAVNPDRLSNITITPSEQPHYQSDIGFVGKLYNSTFPSILALQNDYIKGYLTALVNTQLKIYGHYFVDTLLTDGIITAVANQLEYPISKEELAYSVATYITHNERLILFSQLAAKHTFKLYSYDSNPLLTNVIHQGYVRYLTDMPKVFMSSKINLNVSVKNTQSGIPLRVLDILGCGGFLLSNYQPELAEFFIPNTDFVYYESIEDALEKVDYYLANDHLRQKISLNGHLKCQEHFNYPKQLSTLFHIAGLYP